MATKAVSFPRLLQLILFQLQLHRVKSGEQWGGWDTEEVVRMAGSISFHRPWGQKLSIMTSWFKNLLPHSPFLQLIDTYFLCSPFLHIFLDLCTVIPPEERSLCSWSQSCN